MKRRCYADGRSVALLGVVLGELGMQNDALAQGSVKRAVVTGTITHKDGKPVPYAHAADSISRAMAVSNPAGQSRLSVGSGTSSVVIDGQRVEVSSPPLESIQPRITSMMGGRPLAAVHKRAGSGPDNPSLDEIISPSMIAAIEVYPSAASVPNELQHHTDGCGLILAWTRYGSR